MSDLIKAILAILLFLCLLHMPYGYYQLVRYMAMAGFVLLAYEANSVGRKNEMIIYILLAVLFQPLFKIALGRPVWNIVDVVVGIGLVLSLLKKSK